MKRTTFQVNRLKEQVEAHRTTKFGPLPVNYLKVVRESHDETLESLSSKMGISKHALLRLEQGTFQEILPAAMEYYVAHYEDSELTLMDAYEAFQHQMRSRHFKYFGDHLETEIRSETHPLRELRARVNVNPTELSKALCIPQSTITYFERKPKHQQSVPKCLVNVLKEIGYGHEQINGFREAYKDYRYRLLGTNVIKAFPILVGE